MFQKLSLFHSGKQLCSMATKVFFIVISTQIPCYIPLVEKVLKLGIIFSFEQYLLGIIDFNEASTEGIIEIMRHEHQFSAGHDSDNLVRIFSIGDLLTVERQQNAQDNLSNSASPSARLEGLIPGLADFYSYGNLMEVSCFCLHISK